MIIHRRRGSTRALSHGSHPLHERMSNSTLARATRFISPEWTVCVHADPGVDGGAHYHADLHRSGELVCRIALSGTFHDREQAEDALWTRLKTWLEDYESRPHSGDSGFQIL